MRNLKRALSLTLASVMLLGMMVVGSSAAGFPDVTKDDNVEAIEVLQAVEVMIGDDNGNFGPNDPVNRSQMAVVMANLLNLDYQYYESSCIFWDVPTWARGYVGACYAKGIVSGYGGTTYGAADTVTAVQAASMMMRALGYFQNPEDYKGSFELATVSQGTEIGIFDGVGSSATAPMTRNQVARMALNALESEMVTFTGTPGVTVGDVTVGYRAEYTPRTSTEIKYQAIEKRTSDVSGGNNLNRGQYYIQLGEELFNGKLTKRYARDDFERPSINWQFNGKDIGTYVDYELLVDGGSYTTAVKFSELYELLTYTTINENTVLRFEDGVDLDITRDQFSRSNKDEVGGTGALTEVFLDQERDEIIITTINTYLAKANSNYNSNTESLSLKVYAQNETGVTKIVDSAEVPEVEDVSKDEYVLVYMSGKDSATSLTNYTNYDVVDVFDVEIMGGAEITKYSTNASKVVSKLTTGGTEYDTNRKAFYDHGNVLYEYDNQLLSNMTYNIYMDLYGNVIGVDLNEGTRNYVFITGYDRGRSNISVKTADAAAIFVDGTMDTITVNVSDTNKNIRSALASTREPNAYLEYAEWNLEDSTNRADGGDRNLNRWYTYTVASNGNYTLKPVKNFMFTSYSAANGDFNSDNVKILNCANLFLDDSSTVNGTHTKGRVYGEDASVYITVDFGKVDTSTTSENDAIVDVQGVYTGAQDIKIELESGTGTKGNVNSDKIKDNPPTAQESLAEKDAYVYTVFDNNNYIIASVVMGNAQGAAANYVYVLDGAKNERVERTDSGDIYYWEFDAVVDGEKTALTVREKYSSTLKSNLNENNIVELRFDGDYVVDIKNVDDNDVFYYWIDAAGTQVQSGKIEDKDVYDVGNSLGNAWTTVSNDWRGDGQVHNTKLADKEKAYADHYDEIARVDGTIYLQGRTLKVEKTAGGRDIGLGLVKDAKAVLVQPENGKIESINCDSVQDAIDRLADRDPSTAATGIQFKGRIAAVLDGRGVAKWVVIISDTNLLTGNTPNYNDKWSSGIRNGNITTYVRGVNTYGASSNIGRDGTLYTTLNRIDNAAGRAKADSDMFEIEVWINDRYVGNAVWDSDNSKTVTYAFDDDRISYNSTTEIDVYVTPKTTSKPEDVVINTVNPTVPTVTTLKDGEKLPTASAEEGANYTVRMSWTKDGKTYTEDAVNGEGTYEWTVTLVPNSGYKFASNVVVKYTGKITVEPKEPVTPGQNVTIVFGDNHVKNGEWDVEIVESNTHAAGTMLAKGEGLKTGDKFKFNPYYVLSVKAGNGADYEDVDGEMVWTANDTTITVSTRNGGIWSLGTWQYKLENGKYDFVMNIEEENFARAWQVPQWVKDIKDGKTVYTVVTLDDGSKAVLTIGYEDGIVYGVDEKLTPGVSVEDALGAAGSEENYTPITSVPPTEEDLVGVNENVFAVEDKTANSVKLLEYYPGTVEINALTEKEVADALAALTGKTFAKENVKIAEGKATASDGTVYTFVKGAEPERAWKITYNGGEGVAYGNAETPAKVTDVASGVKYLTKSTAVNATSAAPVAVTNGTATLAGENRDVEYVAVVKLVNTVTNGEINGKVDGEGDVKALLTAQLRANGTTMANLATDSHTYIKVGTPLTVKAKDALNAGESIDLMMNGSVAGTITSNTPETGIQVEVAGDSRGELLLAAAKATVSKDVKVFVNGEDVTPAEGQPLTVTGPVGAKIVKKNASTGKFEAVAGNYAIEGDGKVILDVKNLSDAKNAETNNIEIWTAFSVTDGTNWTACEDSAGTKELADGTLLPVGTTIYVKGTGVLLAKKDSAKELTEERTDGTQALASRTFLYTYTLSDNLAADSFKKLVEFKGSAANAITNISLTGGTAVEQKAVADGVIVIASGAELNLSAKSFEEKTEEKDALIKTGLKASDFTVTGGKTGAETKLHVTINPAATVRASAEEAETYVLTMIVNGVEVPAELGFAVRTPKDAQDYVFDGDTARSIGTWSKHLGDDYELTYNGDRDEENNIIVSGTIMNFENKTFSEISSVLASYAPSVDDTKSIFKAVYQRTWAESDGESAPWSWKYSDTNETPVTDYAGNPEGRLPLNWDDTWGFILVPISGTSEGSEVKKAWIALVVYDEDSQKYRFVERGINDAEGTEIANQGWECGFSDTITFKGGADMGTEYTIKLANDFTIKG